MRLARSRTSDGILPVVGIARSWFDLRPLVPDVTPALLNQTARTWVSDAARTGLLPEVAQPVDFAPPLAPVGKIVCIGLNYAEHAAETGAPLPTEPVVFLKAPDTVIGPDDTVLIPRGSSKTDYEVELAVVIGQEAAYLADDDQARACIAGYTISNDVTEREFQLERGGQWDKGKNCATFSPLGPCIVTDEIHEPQNLRLTLSVNGEVRQKGSTATMLFGVLEIVRYLSHFMTLYPGDVINTGTPAGVALARGSHAYLRAGDIVEVFIEGLGSQRQLVKNA